MYPLTRFLAEHTRAAVKVEGTKEWKRAGDNCGSGGGGVCGGERGTEE